MPVLAEGAYRFPGCEPAGYLLRAAFPERWVRFHNLPGSKRYPGTEGEYATVLDRHNRVLADLAGPEPRVVLLTTAYSDSAAPTPREPEVRDIDPAARPWRTIPMHEIDGGTFGAPTYWHVFAREREWRPGRFDGLVRLVADDVAANVLVVGPDCRWVLHPYDGGMDVILDSAAERDRLRGLHPDWLSARPDGL